MQCLVLGGGDDVTMKRAAPTALREARCLHGAKDPEQRDNNAAPTASLGVSSSYVPPPPPRRYCMHQWTGIVEFRGFFACDVAISSGTSIHTYMSLTARPTSVTNNLGIRIIIRG